MKINEVANITGLTKKAINYYQEKGIINPKQDENGYREFSESDVNKLKEVSLFRSLGLSLNEIRKITESKFSKEELRKCIINKQIENELRNKQTELLEKLLYNADLEEINEEIRELNKKKSIKERLLEIFPGFYGRFYLIHFSRFLEEPIKTEEQEEAYNTIIDFLDSINPPELPHDILNEIDEALDFWTDDRIEEIENNKLQSIENPEKFLMDYSEEIKKYQDFKDSDEYLSSPYGILMETMKAFGESSGYNDIFIPAMRKLSPSYDKYYENLLKANEVFLERFPDYK
ncbi:MerR family transcriptional regulator [Soehngenia longivitae]|uniref:MerR family transcriptional regulator n=1 Tax=Soehngenia longivitae TaxID=2562294 RepID=A0A4Z0D464_9FIRM|nr:MerR family transcriptional regulator [Soehngenia longivitae]TFZ40185.1 MerR family transcriptional regulator [Soehngenia longivitae]